MKRLRMIDPLLVGCCAMFSALATAGSVSNQVITLLQISAAANYTYLSSNALVYVGTQGQASNYAGTQGQAPNITYTFDLINRDVGAGAIYNSLLSSIATANPVTIDYDEICYCGGVCSRTITAITIE